MAKDDLTTGPMLGHFKALAIPAAFGMVFATLYNIVDVYFAGLLSTTAQAGLAIGYQAFFILLAFGFGLGSALTALVSTAKGAGQAEDTRGIALQGLSFGVLACVVLIGLGFLIGPRLIALVSEPGGYRDAANGYYRWLMLSLPGFLLAYGGNGILQAHGDTKSMQRALMVAFVANIGLNPLMMFGIPGLWQGMGFNGIAVATILSQTGVMVYILWRILSLPALRAPNRAEFAPQSARFAAILKQLLPTTFAMLVMFMAGFVVQFALKRFGAEAVAAYGIGLRIEQILLLPVLGMTGALVPIAGQNYGAAKPERVREALFLCWKLGVVASLIALPLMWFGGSSAMGLFTKDPAVIAVGASYLKVDAILFPIYMMLFSINSLLQALKRPIWTLWLSLYRQGFGVAFFIWLMIGPMGMDVWGVWIGIGLAVFSGWAIALVVASRVSAELIGGLWGSSVQKA